MKTFESGPIVLSVEIEDSENFKVKDSIGNVVDKSEAEKECPGISEAINEYFGKDDFINKITALKYGLAWVSV